MTQTNHYQPPSSQVTDVHPQEYAPVQIFSASGRLGRVRYIAYVFGVSFLAYIAVVLLAFLLGMAGGIGGGVLGAILGLVAVIGLFTVHFLLTIQRCHDFNTSGWLSLLLLLNLVFPLVPFLVLALIPGSEGKNLYGPPPPPNGIVPILMAALIPAIFIFGIIAAIAIPAYHGYMDRARQAQTQQQD